MPVYKKLGLGGAQNLIVLLALLMMVVPAAALAAGPAAVYEPQSDRPENLKAVLKEFEEYAEAARRDWNAPGMAVAVVTDQRLVYARGFGIRRLEGSEPVGLRTIFQIGSAAKAFTAALTAIMVDEGRLRWEDRVLDYLPEFRMYDAWLTRQFTLADLMAQRSGLPPYAGDLQALLGFDREHILRSLRFIKPVSDFRTEFAYQNSLFLAAAAILERATGKSWKDNLQKRLLLPLDLHHTSTGLRALQNAEDAACLHRRIKNKVEVLPPHWPYHDWIYTLGPAGGINSNVLDMAVWLGLHLRQGSFEGRKIISRESMAYMHSPLTRIKEFQRGEENHYGQAWMHTRGPHYTMVWHTGETSGAGSVAAMAPQAKIGLVVLVNLSGTGLPEALARRFFDLYFMKPEVDWSRQLLAETKESERGKVRPKPPARPTPPLGLDNYLGIYQNDVYGRVRVEDRDGSLLLVMGPRRVELELRHHDRDAFTLSWPGIAHEAGLVFFEGNDSGRAQSITLEVFNQDGAGVFERVLEEQP